MDLAKMVWDMGCAMNRMRAQEINGDPEPDMNPPDEIAEEDEYPWWREDEDDDKRARG